jgi:hypothetical protein
VRVYFATTRSASAEPSHVRCDDAVNGLHVQIPLGYFAGRQDAQYQRTDFACSTR